MKRTLIISLLIVAASSLGLGYWARAGHTLTNLNGVPDKTPHYCCTTDAGKLGPYPNDGSVKVGDSCYGTDSKGQRHNGTACLGDEDKEGGGGDKQSVPHYCCTDAGKLGPYPNDGSVKVGDSCYGTDSKGQRHNGTACLGENDGSSGGGSGNKDKYPPYCCTNAGKLGPYPNDSVKEGEACYGTDSKGQRQEGKACF